MGDEGTILACFRDTKPSNDFESTRLVARIIQFEYVYTGPAARAGRARTPHVPIGTRVIPARIYRRLYFSRFSLSLPLSLPPLRLTCNTDITIKRMYRPPPLPSRSAFATTSQRFFSSSYTSPSFLSARISPFAFVGNGSSVIEHVCRDILISPARDNTRPHVEDIFITRDAPQIFSPSRARAPGEAFRERHEGFLYERYDADGGCGTTGGRDNPCVERPYPLSDLRASPRVSLGESWRVGTMRMSKGLR